MNVNSEQLAKLGTTLKGQLGQFITDRSLLETQWLKNLRQYQGKYDPDVLAGIPDERSHVYPRDTRVKVKGGVAKMMEMDVLTKADLADLKPHNMDDRTPLWFYVLREAQLAENGERLGPVGARIVAEVLIGLIQGDRTSYLSQDPDWQPFLPTFNNTNQGDDFRMVDLLHFAGVA